MKIFRLFQNGDAPPVYPIIATPSEDHIRPSRNGSDTSSPVNLEDEETVGTSDGSDRSYPRNPAKFKDLYWELGWTDGRTGQPTDEVEAIIAREVEVQHSARVAQIQEELAEAQSRVGASGALD